MILSERSMKVLLGLVGKSGFGYRTFQNFRLPARLKHVLSQQNPPVRKLEPLWRAVGFSDSRAFRRALLRQTGMKPQELLNPLQTPGGPTRESIIRAGFIKLFNS